MSDEEKKPVSRFGSVQEQWGTIGSNNKPPVQKHEEQTQPAQMDKTGKQVLYIRTSDNRIMRRKTNAIPQDLLDRIGHLAINMHEQPSRLLTQAIEEFLEREEPKYL